MEGWENVDWIILDQDKSKWSSFVNMVQNLQVVWNVANFLTSYVIIRYSRRLYTGAS
jgi:hypothetical protein